MAYISISLKIFTFFALALVSFNTPSSAQSALENGELRSKLLYATRFYVQHRQNGQYQKSWEIFTPGAKKIIAFDKYVDTESYLRSKLGSLDHFSVLRVIKYENTDAYVVDFSALYDKDYYECGYFVWHVNEKVFRLGRSERGHLHFSAMNDSNGDELLQKLQCHAHSRFMIEQARTNS